jgi:hypothetical protein
VVLAVKVLTQEVLTAVSTGGSKNIRADSIMNTVYLSKLSSDCSPCLWSRARTKHIGRPALEKKMILAFGSVCAAQVWEYFRAEVNILIMSM